MPRGPIALAKALQRWRDVALLMMQNDAWILQVHAFTYISAGFRLRFNCLDF